MTRYLLRSSAQLEDFRRRYAAVIRGSSQAYVDWVCSLPVWEWSPLLLPTGKEEAVIGLLCCLLIDGHINITFSSSCRSIMRNPLTDEEYEEAFKAQMAKSVRLKVRNKAPRR